ncbi:MAG: hypothetical protein ACLGH0_02890 [Thermoanaerobaculia bacterium]
MPEDEQPDDAFELDPELKDILLDAIEECEEGEKVTAEDLVRALRIDE